MKKFIMGLVLGVLIMSIIPVKAAIEEYICHKADYKVMVNGTEYANSDLPILNYKGNTYVPFKSTLEAAGLNVNWNAKLGQAEVASPTTTNLKSTPSLPSKIFAPDGIQANFYNGKYYIFFSTFTSKYYDDKKYSVINYRNKDVCYITKNQIKIIDNIPLDKKIRAFTYECYINDILPLLN
jgi:hypothetical protein